MKNKVTEFIKTHKVQVAVVAGAVAGIAAWAITRSKPKDYVNIDFPELPTGEWVDLWRGIKGKYAGSVTGVVKGVEITDLGNFGDALATVEGIDPREPIRIIFGTEKSFI